MNVKKKLLASLALAALAFCAMSAPIPSYRVATNIAYAVSSKVVSNTVTRSYIEGLVSGSGGLVNATDIINDITRDSTQATLINRTDGHEDNAIVTIGSVDKQSNLAGLMTVEDKETLDSIVNNLASKADKDDISATNQTFSNAVLAVWLNIDTNSVAVLNDIAATFGGFPIEGTATTVGGLLAALAAAVAWLKKNKVGSFASVGGATATVENGVAKLSDFFTKSNGLLTATIDDRLPIPISEKSEGFTTESYKRFIVTVSGDMTVTLHTPTSSDAEIFECRFNGTSLAADASITFAGATATTMDANCGTVTAGKVALMSAFWNGTTWDVNWKVEG